MKKAARMTRFYFYHISETMSSAAYTVLQSVSGYGSESALSWSKTPTSVRGNARVRMARSVAHGSGSDPVESVKALPDAALAFLPDPKSRLMLHMTDRLYIGSGRSRAPDLSID